MGNGYDMCVDFNSLITAENKIRTTEENIRRSIEMMSTALNNSGNFFAGSQYEKVKNQTAECLMLTKRTTDELKATRNYLNKLMDAVDDYFRCKYSGAE